MKKVFFTLLMGGQRVKLMKLWIKQQHLQIRLRIPLVKGGDPEVSPVALSACSWHFFDVHRLRNKKLLSGVPARVSRWLTGNAGWIVWNVTLSVAFLSVSIFYSTFSWPNYQTNYSFLFLFVLFYCHSGQEKDPLVTVISFMEGFQHCWLECSQLVNDIL